MSKSTATVCEILVLNDSNWIMESDIRLYGKRGQVGEDRNHKGEKVLGHGHGIQV